MGINLPGLITQLISFAILVFLLTRFLYKPVVKLLDERAEKIKKGLSDAETASKGAEEAASKIEEELSQARLEGKKLVEAAREASNQLREDEKEKIAVEISQMMEKAKKEINSERDNAILELKNRFGELVVDAAGKVIEKEIDEKSHSELITKALEEKAL
ncbi:MAG: ATP synthase F0 subunit B [Dehalococcoidia bacterium]|nr:ATP synthase F0 subunit B [Dehalococcoidia bacterium]|tara:strand:- start:60 stop:539 length:480 start_codon:yes stop_codon:yes gene_type:complete